MQVQNNKEEVPFAHYEEKFRALDPIESAKRCGVPFADGKFSVRLLGVTYQITWPDYAITADRDGAFGLSSLPCQTFLLRFLLEGRQAAPSSQFKTFREMPWGEMYIQPYTGRVLTYSMYVTDIMQAGDEWIIFMAMNYSNKSGYSNIVVVTTDTEPQLEIGSQHKLYGTCMGTYEVQSEESGTKFYPCIELLFWDE